MKNKSVCTILGLFLITLIFKYGKTHTFNDFGVEVHEPIKDEDDCQCNVDIVEVEKSVKNAPLYLNSRTGNIIYPSYHLPYFVVKTGNKIEIQCPGGEGIYLGSKESEMKLLHEEHINATCLSKWSFQTGDVVSDLRLVSCSNPIQPSAILTHMKCGSMYTSQNREIQMGYKLANGRFLQRYIICFNFIRRTPVYTRSVLINSYIKPETEKPKKIYLAKDFIRVLSNITIYNNTYLRNVIHEQIGAPAESKQCFDESQNRTIIPIFMVPPADFFYRSEKSLSYYYVNTVPIWKQFYNENWKWVHDLIRDYSYEKKANLMIFTGTYGKTKLFNRVEDRYLHIYLLIRGEKSAIPIPILVWKIIYDVETKAGLAIIGLNSAFKTKNRYEICPDISEMLPWFLINNQAPENLYACSIDDLRVNVPHIPLFEVDDILHLKSNETKYDNLREVIVDEETE